MEAPNDLLEKYFQNKTTADETRKVLTWFSTDEGQRYLSNRLDQDFEKIEDTNVVFLSSGNSADVLKKIYAGDQRSNKDEEGRQRSFPMRAFLKVAAVLVLGLVVGSYFFLRDQSITYTTKFGEKKTVVLPDNSKVTLNGNTTLTISGQWTAESKREVWMEGEAFFSVVHTKNHASFIVYTSDNFNAQVLGTEFNVLSRNNMTKVVLERGKVQLNFTNKGKKSNLTMRPGDLVEYDKSSSFLIKKHIEPVVVTSWKDQSMVFDKISVRTLADMLKNTYGTEIIIEDPTILDKEISGKVPNQSLNSLLKGLAEILEVELVQENGLVYFNKRQNKN